MKFVLSSRSSKPTHRVIAPGVSMSKHISIGGVASYHHKLLHKPHAELNSILVL